MSIVILAFGLVLSVEGLVFALAPKRLEDALEMLRQITPETRRLLGLGSLAVGVFLIWISKLIGS
ncbi:MAG: DUF2065 domain-containing protein [Paracoccaceae bacterium]